MLEKVAIWGLRLIAAVIFLSGLLALASFATTGRVHLSPTDRGHGTTTYSDVHALGIALVILGIGWAALYASAPRSARPNWWRTSTFVLVAVGAVMTGASMLFGA